MRVRSIRSLIVLFALLLLWGLPIPFIYVGGIGNYLQWNWGLYGWLRVFHLKSGFSATTSSAKYYLYPSGLMLTILASTIVIFIGVRWIWPRNDDDREQQTSGLLVFMIPAVFGLIALWWPDVYGVGGNSEDFHFSRGQFGYLVEYRESMDPLGGFLPQHAAFSGKLALSPVGLILTMTASVIIIAVPYWFGNRISRSILRLR